MLSFSIKSLSQTIRCLAFQNARDANTHSVGKSIKMINFQLFNLNRKTLKSLNSTFIRFIYLRQLKLRLATQKKNSFIRSVGYLFRCFIISFPISIHWGHLLICKLVEGELNFSSDCKSKVQTSKLSILINLCVKRTRK